MIKGIFLAFTAGALISSGISIMTGFEPTFSLILAGLFLGGVAFIEIKEG